LYLSIGRLYQSAGVSLHVHSFVRLTPTQMKIFHSAADSMTPPPPSPPFTPSFVTLQAADANRLSRVLAIVPFRPCCARS